VNVEPIKKETLTEQIMNQLADKITSGEIQPGERLPDERSLAAMFGVTRSRIREALRALSLVGLIHIRPGGGSFAAERSGQLPREAILWSFHREIENYEDLYAARRLIETVVHTSCFDCKTDEVVARLAEFAEELLALDIIEVPNEEFSDLIDRIDTYVGENCGNGIYSKLMQTMIILRHESALKILDIPASRQSAILWRVKILKSFGQEDRSQLETTLDGFFTSSVEQLPE